MISPSRNVVATSTAFIFAIACGAAITDATKLAEAEKRVFGALNAARQSHGLDRLIPDAALTDVCRTHAEDMAKAGYVGPISPRLGSLRSQLARAGVTAMSVSHLLACVRSVDALKGKFATPPYRVSRCKATHVGIGIAWDKKHEKCYAAIVAITKRVELEPFPIENVAPGRHMLRGKVLSPYVPVYAYVESPSHMLRGIEIRKKPGGEFEALVPFEDGPGAYVVSLVVDDGASPLVSDRIVSYVGQPYPVRVRRARSPAARRAPHGPRLSGKSFDLIKQVNAARASRGATPLRIDSQLMDIAIENTRVMVRLDRPDGSVADAMIRRSGLRFKHYRIALFVRPEMPTAGQLKIVLDSRYTHIGVAIMEATTARYGESTLWGTVVVMRK